jgi:hypothetical protein
VVLSEVRGEEMNRPTMTDKGKPVVSKSGTVWEIRFRGSKPGIWTKYRGWRDSVNWANWEHLERLPVGNGVSTPAAGAGGMP